MYELSLYAMGALYVLAGLNHFRKPSFYLPLMPSYIPAPRLMIFLSGVAEVVLGGLLFWQETRPWAAWLIILMLLVFCTVHIYMYQERNGKFAKIPNFIIVARLPLQLLLIFWAYIYTQPL